MPELHQLALRWLHETANGRVHGITYTRPCAHLQDKRPALLPLPAKPAYDTSILVWRRSSREGLVSYKAAVIPFPGPGLARPCW